MEPWAPIPMKDGGRVTPLDQGDNTGDGDRWSDSECVLMEERRGFVIPVVGQNKRGVKDNSKFWGKI